MHPVDLGIEHGRAVRPVWLVESQPFACISSASHIAWFVPVFGPDAGNVGAQWVWTLSKYQQICELVQSAE